LWSKTLSATIEVKTISSKIGLPAQKAVEEMGWMKHFIRLDKDHPARPCFEWGVRKDSNFVHLAQLLKEACVLEVDVVILICFVSF